MAVRECCTVPSPIEECASCLAVLLLKLSRECEQVYRSVRMTGAGAVSPFHSLCVREHRDTVRT